MRESYLSFSDCTMYVRHRFAGPHRPTTLLIHGLGESALCFEDAFHQPALGGFNLIVPDLAGYGRRSSAASYSFDSQLARIGRLLAHFDIGKPHVLRHSLGSDLAILAGQTVAAHAAAPVIL